MGNGGMFIILGDRGGSDVLSREMETGHPTKPNPTSLHPTSLYR